MAKKKSTAKKRAGKKKAAAAPPAVRSTGQFRSSSSKKKVTSSPVLEEREESYSDYDDYDDYEEEPGEKYMTLGDHLEELRKRILWAVGIVILISAVAGYFSFEIHNFIIAPYRLLTNNQNLILMNVYGPMEAIVKLSLLVGFVLSFPLFLFILFGFITPALSRLASSLGYLAMSISALLFWGGMAFAWFYVIPISLEFMFTDFLPSGITPQLSLERYYSFIFMIELAAGIVFQMPLIFIILGSLGILTLEFHKQIWKHVIVGIFVFSAIVTPPDPVSQVLFSAPLILLYVMAVITIYWIERWKRRRDKKLEAELTA